MKQTASTTNERGENLFQGDKWIEIWLDATSEPGVESWIVSLEDDSSSKTLAAFPNREDAENRALVEAVGFGLRVVDPESKAFTERNLTSSYGCE